MDCKIFILYKVMPQKLQKNR